MAAKIIERNNISLIEVTPFCTYPERRPSRLTIHILAAVAEHEREMISKRTKDALKAAKARGTRLGNPTPFNASLKARAVWQAQSARFRDTIIPLIKELQAKGYSYNAIARELNRRSIPTAHGREWHRVTVSNLLKATG